MYLLIGTRKINDTQVKNGNLTKLHYFSGIFNWCFKKVGKTFMITFYYIYLFVQEGATHTRSEDNLQNSPLPVYSQGVWLGGKGLYQLSHPTSTAMIIF